MLAMVNKKHEFWTKIMILGALLVSCWVPVFPCAALAMGVIGIAGVSGVTLVLGTMVSLVPLLSWVPL